MSIQPIAPLEAASADRMPELAQPAQGVDFSAVVGGGLQQLDQSLAQADAQVRALAAGQDVPVHEVMIALEQARVDMTFAVEVRNRLLESYQELTRMQL